MGNAPFWPHRFAHLVHLTLVEQPFDFWEAVIISQLPGLRSRCLIELRTYHPAEVWLKGIVLPWKPWDHTLPVPCMLLTQVTSLSLDDSWWGEAIDMIGISFLTNLRSFTWSHYVAAESPWRSIRSLPNLKCLNLAGFCGEYLLSIADLTRLEVLDVAGIFRRVSCGTLNRLRAVNCITQLTVSGTQACVTAAQGLTALQHLVLVKYSCSGNEDRFGKLDEFTRVTKLEIKCIWVHCLHDRGYTFLLKALRAMTQLIFVGLSLQFSPKAERDATKILAKMRTLSSLVCLEDLSIICQLWSGLQLNVAKYERVLQQCLKHAQIQVIQQEAEELLALYHSNAQAVILNCGFP